MDQYKRVRLRRSRRLPNQRDTPLKPALERGGKKRRLLPRKHCEAIPEELEVDEMNKPSVKPNRPVKTSTVPAHSKSVLRLSNPAVTENPRHKAASTGKKPGHQVSKAGHPTIQLTPIPEAFKGDEMPGKLEEQSLAVTPASIMSSTIQSDTTFNSDEEDEDCHFSASTTSSSLPSPEIFRKENYAETLTFPGKKGLLGLHLNIKNSTLLDMSHAESIHMHHPPNLSTIIDASTILAEKNCEISNHREPEAESKVQTESFKSDKAFKMKTPPKLTSRRPILLKKKLRFKSPIVDEIFTIKHTPASKLSIYNTSGPFQTSSPPEQMRPESETSRTGEISAIKEALHLKRPRKSSPEKAKFFDFVSDNERDAFFQKMRERFVKLRSAVLFPLPAAKHKEPPVL